LSKTLGHKYKFIFDNNAYFCKNRDTWATGSFREPAHHCSLDQRHGGVALFCLKSKKPGILFLIAVYICLYPLTSKNIYATSLKITSICDIQGSGFKSPYEGKSVKTRGIVHGDLDNALRRGFFMQSEYCDGNDATSDGIFVYLDERIDIVSTGDWVEVTGTVLEYYGLTEIHVKPEDVTIISTGNPLPEPLELSPPFDNLESNKYFEQLEGMRVNLTEAITVGPTDQDDRSWIVRADMGLERIFYNDPRGTGEIICVDDGGLFEISPEVRVGNRVNDLLGAMDYSGGDFCLQLFSQPLVIQTTRQTIEPLLALPEFRGVSASEAGGCDTHLHIATFNLANLFDTYDDPDTEDTILSASEYQTRLTKRARAIHEILAEPEIIALQEAENYEVIQALVNRPEIESDYQIVWQDSPDVRGLDLGLLFQPDRVQLIGSQVRQACTKLVDGLGPDGNRDVYNPQNAITCDTDGDGVWDGNRLFSRPPMIVQLHIVISGCANENSGYPITDDDALDVWILNNHWKSKLQDTETTEYTLPRRIEQAHFVASLVEEIISTNPGAILVVLGDLNDHHDSQPLEIITNNLDNLFERVPSQDKYTYIYHGVSQTLDHALVRPQLPIAAVNFTALHINADFPAIFESVTDSYYRSSDHDMLLFGFAKLNQHFLPWVQR